jgi:hypothetical protein
MVIETSSRPPDERSTSISLTGGVCGVALGMRGGGETACGAAAGGAARVVCAGATLTSGPGPAAKAAGA